MSACTARVESEVKSNTDTGRPRVSRVSRVRRPSNVPSRRPTTWGSGAKKRAAAPRGAAARARIGRRRGIDPARGSIVVF